MRVSQITEVKHGKILQDKALNARDCQGAIQINANLVVDARLQVCSIQLSSPLESASEQARGASKRLETTRNDSGHLQRQWEELQLSWFRSIDASMSIEQNEQNGEISAEFVRNVCPNLAKCAKSAGPVCGTGSIYTAVQCKVDLSKWFKMHIIVT